MGYQKVRKKMGIAWRVAQEEREERSRRRNPKHGQSGLDLPKNNKTKTNK